MSFGDLPYAGGYVGITHKMSLKCTRNLAKYKPNMSPRETRLTTKQNRAQKRGEQGHTQSNHVISTKYPHRMTQEDQRRSLTKVGPIQSDWWPNQPQTLSVASYHHSNVGCMGITEGLVQSIAVC